MGGDSAKDQMRALQEGVDIVTGTPGRLDDFISTGKLDLSGVGGACFHSNANTPPLSLQIRFFVLDEAVGSIFRLTVM